MSDGVWSRLKAFDAYGHSKVNEDFFTRCRVFCTAHGRDWPLPHPPADPTVTIPSPARQRALRMPAPGAAATLLTTPDELCRTLSGGVITLVSSLIMFCLFISEFSARPPTPAIVQHLQPSHAHTIPFITHCSP